MSVDYCPACGAAIGANFVCDTECPRALYFKKLAAENDAAKSKAMSAFAEVRERLARLKEKAGAK